MGSLVEQIEQHRFSGVGLLIVTFGFRLFNLLKDGMQNKAKNISLVFHCTQLLPENR